MKNNKDYDKHFFLERVKEYASLRTLGYTIEEIEEIFLEQYQIHDISTFRKACDLLGLVEKVEVKIDSEVGLKKLAIAKNKILIDRKINVKQRSLLNNDANVVAYRNLILDTLKSYHWKEYPSIEKVSEIDRKLYKNAVYIIADEHFKGECDIEHLNKLYDSIEQDIWKEQYSWVEFWYLGDGTDGLIHAGSLANNDGAILPSIQYANILIERINKIRQVQAVKFVCQSNHTQTRPLGTNRNELAKEDLGYVIASMLKLGLRKNIELICNDIIIFKYNNLDIALLHGHQPYAKSKAKMIEYWSSKYGVVPDITIMGHWHTEKINEFGNNKWLVVAPTAKNFNGDYEHENGYISTNQIMRLEIEDNIPQFKTIKIENNDSMLYNNKKEEIIKE